MGASGSEFGAKEASVILKTRVYSFVSKGSGAACLILLGRVERVRVSGWWGPRWLRSGAPRRGPPLRRTPSPSFQSYRHPISALLENRKPPLCPGCASLCPCPSGPEVSPRPWFCPWAQGLLQPTTAGSQMRSGPSFAPRWPLQPQARSTEPGPTSPGPARGPDCVEAAAALAQEAWRPGGAERTHTDVRVWVSRLASTRDPALVTLGPREAQGGLVASAEAADLAV